MNKKSIKVNAILNSLRTILNLIFPLITFPYVARVLSVGEIGKYNFSLSIVSYFMLISALGIDKYAVREGAKYRDHEEAIGKFSSQVFSLNICSTIFSYVLLFAYLIFSKKASSYRACILIFSLQIIFTTIGTEWLYTIFEDYTYITIRSIAFKVISIILLFMFVRHSGDYLKYAAISSFASVGSNVMNFIHARKFCKIRFTLKINWREMLVPVLVIFASNVAIQIYVSSDTTMLGYLKDDYTVGIYSFATKIYNAVKPVLIAAVTVAIPRFSYYAGKGMKKEYDDLILKVANTLFLITIPAMTGLAMLSRNVILILGGKNYLPAEGALRLLIIGIVLSLFSALFNECVQIPFKREKWTLLSSCVSALENILLNLWLIPLLAEKGAAITTVLAEFTMAAMNFYNSRDIMMKTVKDKKTILNVISVLAGSSAIMIACFFISRVVSNMILETVISIIISIVIYIVVLFILRNPFVHNVQEQLLRKIKQS